MNYYPQYIPDVLGNYYIGINIPEYDINLFLEELKEILGEEDYETYTKLQKNRDHGKYHITLINTIDYQNLLKSMGVDHFVNSLDKVFKYEIDDIKLLGIGTATKGTNKTYFIVIKSEKLNDIRDRYNLPEQDFHITIGFKWKDVHGVRKNIIMKKENLDFFKHLKNLYYINNEKFDFLKKISGFEFDKDEKILAIEVRNTSAIFCSGINYFTVCLIENNLKVVAQWQGQKPKSWISSTQLNEIFKK